MDKKNKVIVVAGTATLLLLSGTTAATLFPRMPAKVAVVTTDEKADNEQLKKVGKRASSSTTERTSTSLDPPPETAAPTPTPAPAPTPTPVAPKPTPKPTPALTPTYAYRNGTFVASSNYAVPGASNTLTTRITISQDKVAAVSSSHVAPDPDSQPFINGFNSGVSSAVVGRSLAGLSASRIGGASLTTAAFNSNLNAIRSQAKN